MRVGEEVRFREDMLDEGGVDTEIADVICTRFPEIYSEENWAIIRKMVAFEISNWAEEEDTLGEKVTKEDLIEQLKQIAVEYYMDAEVGHIKADELLLDYIDDNDVRAAYFSVMRWYS